MGRVEFPKALRGVGVTPVTPFSDDLGSVNVTGLQANLEFLGSAGVRLLYPCGNTGEFNSLSLEEWTSVVEISVQMLPDMTVAPGVGQGLANAMEMLRRVEDLGARGVLLMPPHPTFVSTEGLRAYYLRLTERSPVPVVLYKRGGRPSDELLVEVAALDGVAGVKYGDADVNAFAKLASVESDVVWTCGLAERWAPFFHLAGAEGFTSGLANFAPKLALDLFAALNAGDYATAMKTRSTCLVFEEIRARGESANNVAAVKAAMDAQGLAGGKVRPPLRDLDSETAKEVLLTISGWT